MYTNRSIMSTKTEQSQVLPVRVPVSLVAAVERYASDRGLRSRNKAAAELLQLGLERTVRRRSFDPLTGEFE